MPLQQARCLLLFATLLLFALTFVSAQPRSPATSAFEKVETRCGWFSNPTPANASLYDRDDEWIISVQGGHQAEGDWPEFSPKQWVDERTLWLRLRLSSGAGGSLQQACDQNRKRARTPSIRLPRRPRTAQVGLQVKRRLPA